MDEKVEEKFEETTHVKNNDKYKKNILGGERNVRYHERIPANKNQSYTLYSPTIC